MLIEFDKNDEILKSDDFLADDGKYNIVYRIVDDGKALMLKNKSNTGFLCQTNPEYRMVIWFSEKASLSERSILINKALDIVKNYKEKKFLASHDVIEEMKTFISPNEKITTQYSLKAYICEKVIMPTEKGQVMIADNKDIEIITDYVKDFYEFINKKEENRDNIKIIAMSWIKNKSLYVLKVNTKIVSIVNVNIRTEKYGRIGPVYTPLEERRKGYGAYLVAAVSDLLLREGLLPILYADSNYIASNKAYTNVGYINKGELVECDITVKKQDQL